MRRTLGDAYHWVSDPRFREYERQRRITAYHDRVEAAAALAGGLPRPDASAGEDDLLALRRDGYLMLNDLVADWQISNIVDHFSELRCHDPYRPQLGEFSAPASIPPETHVAHYRVDDILRAPHLLGIANDPRVLSLVGGYLGAKPTLTALRVWWSTPGSSGGAEHAELFHRDVDDLRFLKLFVYLTAVDEDTGPHVFIAGSHASSQLSGIRRLGDEEVEAAFGKDAERHFTGPAGTSFVEDTYGIHRGQPPRMGARLIFQPLYALRPTIYGPRRPLRRSASGLDPYVNRMFLKP